MTKRIYSLLALLAGMSIILLSGCDKRDNSAELKEKTDRYVQYWNTGQFEGIDGLMCPDFELIQSPEFKPRKGLTTFRQEVTNFRAAYPDLKIVLDEMIYDEDKVAAVWTLTATHTGPGSRPPTGKQISVKGISVIHFRDGKIKDEWIAGNDLAWVTQLGYTVVAPQ